MKCSVLVIELLFEGLTTLVAWWLMCVKRLLIECERLISLVDVGF
ncbi:MAG: hypothetical protein RMH77_07440 [Sulfolobales archaeon]|nr:hypothetical protein [Sulfolobales archaeon]